MKYGSLFTGIGGFDLGFDRAGMRGEWQIERDKDCNRVLGRQWRDTQRGTDVREVTRERFGPVDVICGGFPCQDVSVAGKRAGLAGERSGLWSEFHRIIAEFTPRFCVIENVPGLFSSHGGGDFLTIIRGLAQLGYCVGWAVLDSQYRGVAQRRDRVFIVGSLGNGSCAEILFEPESLRGDSAPSRETGKEVAGTIGGSSQSGGFRTTDLDNCGCYIANDFANMTFEPAEYARPLSTSADRTRAAPIVTHSLSAEGADASEDGTGRGTPIVVTPILEAGARTGKSTDDRTCGIGIGNEGDPMFTLQSGKQHAIAFAENQRGEIRTSDISPQLSCSGGKPGSGYSAVAFTERSRAEGRTLESQEEVAYALTNPGSGGRTHSRQIAQGMSVRRLTPRECERLQGFPDDWTRWDAEGKEISDSARYRMLGNAVTVTVTEWLGQQILKRGA